MKHTHLSIERFLALYRPEKWLFVFPLFLLACSKSAAVESEVDTTRSSIILNDSDSNSDSGFADTSFVDTSFVDTSLADFRVDSESGVIGDSDSHADSTGNGNVEDEALLSSDVDSGVESGIDSGVDSSIDSGNDSSFEGDLKSDSGGSTGFDTGTIDSAGDTSRSSDAESGVDSGCQCRVHQECDTESGECLCLPGYLGDECDSCDSAAGYVAWPQNSGECVMDPCINVGCGDAGACVIGNNGLAMCNCTNGRSGLNCNQQWQTFQVPPFVTELALDHLGNGWFATTQGLLYWDFNGTPLALSDDTQQLFKEAFIQPYDTGLVVDVAIDSTSRKWLATRGALWRFDDGGTPLVFFDDNWQEISVSLETYDIIDGIHIDAQDRIWIVPQDGTGTYMQSIDDLLANDDDVSWHWLFPDEKVLDISSDDDGIWLAAESGLHYVSPGDSLFETDDDIWRTFDDVDALHEQVVARITVDGAGVKWFTTDTGIVRLDDGGNPLEVSGHIWSVWAPVNGSETTQIGPVLAVGADNARWIKSPFGAALRIEAGASEESDWRAYHPRTCTQFEDGDFSSFLYYLWLDDANTKWVATRGDLYIWDDAGTPTATHDDVWTFAGRPPNNHSTAQVVPQSGGGAAWIGTIGPVHGPLSCNTSLQWFDMGVPLNAFDDTWRPYATDDLGWGCVRLAGYDARDYLWIKTFSPNGGHGPHHMIDDNGTPGEQDDDMVVSYSSDTNPIYIESLNSFDEAGGIWFGDTSDDRLTTVDDYRPSAVETEMLGNIWMGYRYFFSDEVAGSTPLRNINDGGTPFDVTDDLWTEFNREDGLPLDRVKVIRIDSAGVKWLLGSVSLAAEPQLASLNDNGTPSDKSDDRWMSYSTNDGLADSEILSVAIDSNDDIWIATLSGINYLHLDR